MNDIAVIYDLGKSELKLVGTGGGVSISRLDSFYSFKKQLDEFVKYVRSGIRPYPFEETIELMEIIIAGIRSRNEGGRKIMLDEIKKEVNEI